MASWYVLQVLTAQEKKVKKALEDFKEQRGMVDLIEEVLLPTENVSEVKHGETRIVEKKLWPGYLLIKMTITDDSWDYIRNTTGVVDFLGGGDTPTPLTDSEVVEILKDLKEKKEKVVQKHQIEVGDHVKIIDGVFVNFIGTVTDVFHDKGRLSVTVSIFGRETQVDDLEFSQIEKVNEEMESA